MSETGNANVRDPVLTEREKTHGNFSYQGEFAQQLKALFHRQPKYVSLQPAQVEALDLIATKLSRILHGNHAEPDHWLDIAGYAKLGMENCVGYKS